MSGFISFSDSIKQFLTVIVPSPDLHAKWLNTLSYMENSGARKIAACEHPTLVKEEVLKHAAEEFRHAHYLKKQIKRVISHTPDTYANPFILGGTATLHYLSSLDLQTCRYLKSAGFNKSAIKEIAYLLVTYAIELRAEEMYPIYHEILKKYGSKVTIKSILLEEKEHLREMHEGINKLSSGFLHAKKICTLEGDLCKKWILSINRSLLI